MIIVLSLLVCAAKSSIYKKAKPNHTIENADGTVTYEFLFLSEDFDEEMALRKIDEFLSTQGNYEVISVTSKYIEKTNRLKAAALGAILAAAAAAEGTGSDEQIDPHSLKDQCIRILVTVKFK